MASVDADSGPFDLTVPDLERVEQYRRRKASAVLAIMLDDIARSGALHEELGASAWARRREEHDALLRASVEAADAGSVVRSDDDGALAVFCDPGASVERALDLQIALRARRHLEVRIGIDLGQVSERAPGDVVAGVLRRYLNRTARIRALARPGHILVTFPVYDRAVGPLRSAGVAWHNHGIVPLRGFAEPVALYEPYRPDRLQPQPTLQTQLEYASPGWTASGIRPPPAATAEVTGFVSRDVALEAAALGLEPWTTCDDANRAARTILAPGRRSLDEGDLWNVADPVEHYARKIAEAAAAVGGSRDSEAAKTSGSFARHGWRRPVPARVLWAGFRSQGDRWLCDLLHSAGVDVDATSSTEEARRMLRSYRYSMLIFDMGGGARAEGLEFLRWLRRRHGRVPAIVFASTDAVVDAGLEAYEAGAVCVTSGSVSLLHEILTQLNRSALVASSG